MVIDSNDLLLTSAEISVAFMGFASLVAVFVDRGPEGLSDRARVALRSLIDYGLFALFACGLPFVVPAFSLPSIDVWALASGGMAAFTTCYLIFSHRYYQEIQRLNLDDGTWLPRITILGDLLMLIALVGNALGWPYNTSFQVYLWAAVFWNLFGAAISFRGLVAMFWTVE